MHKTSFVNLSLIIYAFIIHTALAPKKEAVKLFIITLLLNRNNLLSLREADWDEILYSIDEQGCTPFIGAGAGAFQNEEGKPWPLRISFPSTMGIIKTGGFPSDIAVDIKTNFQYVVNKDYNTVTVIAEQR